MTINQISVFLENRAGQLSEICSVLSEYKINLRAINIAETTDYGVLRLIADKPQQAAEVLLNHGFILSMTPVVAVAVPDRPGGLAELLSIFASANMDIEYMYSVFGEKDGHAFMIFRVSSNADLAALLAGHDIYPVDGSALGLH